MAPAFRPFEVSTTHLAYTVLGGFVVIFGMFSLLVKERLYIGEAVWATVFGIIIGPHALKLFDPRGWGSMTPESVNDITLEVTRVVLAVGVFAIGVELPQAYMGKHWKSLFFLLVPVMTFGWFVSAGFIFWLIPDLSFLSSLVVAACLTPTDPILAAAVVGGKFADKHVPAHLRHLLTAESGCNDGMAFPFLFIGLYLALTQSDGEAIGEWFYITWAYNIVLGSILGSIIGYSFRHLMKFCERRDLIDRQSYVAQYVSLAILSIGITTLLGSDDLLAAFFAGTAFAYDGWFNKKTEESQFSNVIDLLFNCACFIYIGAWIPFTAFNSEVLSLTPWRLVVIAIFILLFRRLPIMILIYRWIPDIKTLREAVFSGHFGPIGVGAVFISTLAATKLPIPHDPPEGQLDILATAIEPIVAFMVLCSIAVHGLSIPFFSLGKRVHSVSRTWSRHQSIETNTPEWTNQARRVTRAEDIVINRDKDDALDDAEKGQQSRADSAHEASSSSPVNGEVGKSSEKIYPFMRSDSDSETRWRQGRHLVIERKCGEGEEVEVDVIRNAYADGEGAQLKEDYEKLKKTFRGAEDAVKAEVRRYMAMAKGSQKSASDQQRAVSNPAEEDDGEWNDESSTEQDEVDTDVAEQSGSTASPLQPQSLPSPSSTLHRGKNTTSRPTVLGQTIASRRRQARQQARDRKQSHSSNPATPPAHVIDSVPSTSTPPSPEEDETGGNSDQENDPEVEETPRGRSTKSGRSLSPKTRVPRVTSTERDDATDPPRPRPRSQLSRLRSTDSPNPSVLRLRLDSVKNQREASPARSVRFSDVRQGDKNDGGTATPPTGSRNHPPTTPRRPLSPSHSGHDLAGHFYIAASGNRGEETPGSHVLFDLPPARPSRD